MNTKKQHTVTRAYLARWADDAGIVHVFDFRTGEPRRENISTVTAQGYFYSPPDGEQQFERALALMETFWIRAQDDLIATTSETRRSGKFGPKVIYKPDKEQLADSLVQQLVRTERVRRGFLHLDESAARSAHTALMTRPDVIALARQLDTGIWLVGVRDAQRASLPLYTSDHPVSVVPFQPGSSTERHRVRAFMFPLSPDHLLVIYTPGATRLTKEWDGRLVQLSESQILKSNTLQTGSAVRIVILSSPEFDLARRQFLDHRSPAAACSGK